MPATPLSEADEYLHMDFFIDNEVGVTWEALR